MKLFKDNQGNVFAYELDGSQDHLIGDKTAITQEESNAIIQAKKQVQFDTFTYAEKRASEYPNPAEYLDGVVKGDQAQIDKYIADCLAVKARHPKGVA